MNKNSYRLSRRTMLRGCGAAISLPLLEVMQTEAGAAEKKTPTRLAYLYFPNGSASGSWDAKQVGKDGKLQKLNKWMAPFESLKSDLIIPRNVWTPRGNGHGAGTATWLTGAGYNHREIDAGGVSVDQIAARTIGKQTLLPSMELSVRGEGFFSKSLSRNTISWTSSNTPAVREIEPRVIFDRMFRTGENSNLDRSVLDLVLDQAKSLRRKVSVADQRKVEQYLESLRAIEKRIEFAKKQSKRASAAIKAALKRPPSGIPKDHGEYLRLMMDMVYLSFWADATRVCTFMLDHGQSNRYFNFVKGVKGTWHALSHWRDISGRTEDDDGKTSWSSRTEKRDMYNRVTQWHHEHVAYLIKRLKQTPEGDGNLLDHSMIVYGSSLSDGHAHSSRNLPLLLAGGGNGTLKTGRQINYRSSTSMSRLHLSLLKRMGLPLKRFGDAKTELDELG